MKLSKAKRLTYRRAIAAAMAEEEWRTIYATMEEFGGGFEEDWFNTDLEGYVLAMTVSMPDDSLHELAVHLNVGEVLSLGLEEPEFWKQNQLKVFISHLAKHKTFASELQAELGKRGITAFVAHEDIEPTKEWQTEIERALASCDALIALLHDGFKDSTWTDHEIGYVLGRARPVFSVRLGMDPYGLFAKTQAFSGQGKSPEQLAIELFHALRTNSAIAGGLAETVLALFEQSSTSAIARQRISWIEDLPTWRKGFGERLLEAVADNEAIAKSHSVPDLVKQIIKNREPDLLQDTQTFDDEIPF